MKKKMFESQGKKGQRRTNSEKRMSGPVPPTRTTGREGKFGATRGETPSRPTFPREISKQTIWFKKKQGRPELKEMAQHPRRPCPERKRGVHKTLKPANEKDGKRKEQNCTYL